MQAAIEGYYDGKRILPLSKIQSGKHYRVKITFLEELTPEEEIRLASSYSDAFEFWNDPREDLYQGHLVTLGQLERGELTFTSDVDELMNQLTNANDG